MADHQFHLKAHFPGLRNSVGTIESGQLRTKVSIPPEMNGPGVGTNPDEMLLGAAATCYIITLAAMMERSKVEKNDLSMESTAIVNETNGVLTYKKIIHKPTIVLTNRDNERDRDLALKLAKKAEASCMISRAIQGNVDIELEVTIR